MSNPLARIARSVAKRVFWREHLALAQEELRRLRIELPTAEMMMTIPHLFRGKGFYGSMELKQNMLELLGLVRALQALPPLRRVCEIGTFKGGTLFIWCQVAAPDATLLSVDLPGGRFGGGTSERSLPFFQSFRQPGQTLHCIRGDSHDAGVRAAVQETLGGEPLDFLFIDGDHRYAGAKQDFEAYSPLVRAGGVIAFHDIVERPRQPDIEVHRLWAELKARYRHEEFIESTGARRKIGIGLLRKD